jgi:hypothetical protein
MAIQLGRWKCSTSLIGARDGAFVRSIADDDGPVRARTHDAAPDLDEEGDGDGPEGRVTHTHIYLPADWFTQPAPRRTTHDTMAPIRRPAVRRGDQERPEPDEVFCRVMQNGETGDWMAEDCDGRPLSVRTAGDGTLEILHHPDNGEDAGDPGEQLGMKDPLAADQLVALQHR